MTREISGIHVDQAAVDAAATDAPAPVKVDVDPRLQPLSWPVWREPAPHLPPPPEHIAYSRVGARPTVYGMRVDVDRLALIFHRVARLVHGRAGRRTCCYGYRYGHGWTRTRVEQMEGRQTSLAERAAMGAAKQPKASHVFTGVQVLIEADELVVALQHGRHAGAYDYVIQGPPQPCPTCGCPPPAGLVARWLDHVAKHR